MSTAQSVPGVVMPTVKPYPEGANSARNAGIAINNANTKQQTSLIKTAHGGSKRIKRQFNGGATNQITVPTTQVLYPEPGSGNQTVNGNITLATKLGATSAANSVYDSCIGQGASCTAQVAAQSAGKRKSRGGLKWGCYSGGKKYTRITRKKKETKKLNIKLKRKTKTKKGKMYK